jgi:hypothetical protein
MTTSPNPCRGFRFPAEIIEHAVWLYALDLLIDRMRTVPLLVMLIPLPGGLSPA